MKLLFIYPSARKTFVKTALYSPINAFVPPLGLLYLARMVEQQGHTVEVIDFNAEKFNEASFQRAILSSDAVGMTLLSKPKEIENSIAIAQKIHQLDSDIPLILGGPHCNFFPEQALRDHHADVCVQGEGEYIIGPLVEVLEGKRNPSSIPGLVYRQNDTIYKNELQPPIMDLDQLPYPSRHLVSKYEYGYIFGTKIMDGKVTSLISSRGCPYRCTFCQLSSPLRKFRTRSVTNTVQEIDELVYSGYNSIAFADDNFLADKKRVEQIMDHIIQQRYDLKLWILDTRVDSADKNVYEKMRDAGVELISFGIESGNQDILDFYNKKITLEGIRKAIKLSKEMGFVVDANFILGAPFETKKHFNKTIEFAKSLPLDHVTFGQLVYLIGTPLWDDAVKKVKLDRDDPWLLSDGRKGLALYDSSEIQKYCKKGFYSFCLNPRYWFREIYYALSHQNLTFIKLGLRMMKNNLEVK